MMLSLKKLEKIEYENKQKKKIERELPYFITIVTLLATSGLGPYFIFQKIREFNLLPTIRAESEKILKRDRKSTRLNSSHIQKSRMPSSA